MHPATTASFPTRLHSVWMLWRGVRSHLRRIRQPCRERDRLAIGPTQESRSLSAIDPELRGGHAELILRHRARRISGTQDRPAAFHTLKDLAATTMTTDTHETGTILISQTWANTSRIVMSTRVTPGIGGSSYSAARSVYSLDSRRAPTFRLRLTGPR
jgi:hypothetical protein